MRPKSIVRTISLIAVTGKRNARTRLLEATIELIWRGGLAAATPAAVAEHAGAGKMSLYRHFAGKDELVTEALKAQDPRQRALVLGKPGLDPRERILNVFERQAAAADRAGDRYRGCPFVRAKLHFEDDGHPAAPVVTAHKDEMIKEIASILSDGGQVDPEATARVVLMLFDGATIHAEIRGNGEPFRQARAALAVLLSDSENADNSSPPQK